MEPRGLLVVSGRAVVDVVVSVVVVLDVVGDDVIFSRSIPESGIFVATKRVRRVYGRSVE